MARFTEDRMFEMISDINKKSKPVYGVAGFKKQPKFNAGGAAGCPQGYHWDEATQTCVSNFFTASSKSKSIDPLNSTKKAAAINTLKNPPVAKKTTEIQKVNSNSSIPKVQHVENSLDKPMSLAESLKEFDNKVKSLVTSGDAARLLKDKYFAKDNTKSLEQLTREALTSDPQFLQKIEQHKLEEFKQNEQKAYDNASILEKTANAVSAFMADPVLTGANLMSGQRPLIGQSGALRDEDFGYHDYYRKITGADTNVLNDWFNFINPASYATSAGVNANKDNYGQAALNLTEAFMAGADLSALGELGVKGVNLADKAGKYLTTQTPLKNAYNLLPEGTFSGYSKLRNANKSYRVAGMDAYDDFVESGVLRSKTPNIPVGASLEERMMGARHTGFPSFQKGNADLRYLPEEGGVIFETSLPTFKRGEINPVTGLPIKGRHYAHRVIEPNTGATMTSIPGENISVFSSQPHWLKGYKQINTPRQLPGSSVASSVDDVGRGFKSEIDWAKWNPDTPKYPELINEYNAIEESTKKAGTWMKNPDGSPFQGTPEQFIQQQSSWFKKAFPQGSREVYRGVGVSNANPDFSQGNSAFFGDRGIFTANKNLAKEYAHGIKSQDVPILTPFDPKGKPGIYSLSFPKGKQIDYNADLSHWTDVNLAKSASKINLEANLNSVKERLERFKKMNNPLDAELIATYEKRVDQLQQYIDDYDDIISDPEAFNIMRKQLGDITTTDDIAAYIPKTDLNNITLRNIIDGGLGDVTIVNSKPGNYLKSNIGNVGFFDMTNPNIYKSLIGIGLFGTGAAASSNEYQQGGYIEAELSDKEIKDLEKQGYKVVVL